MTRTYAASVNSYLTEPNLELRVLADVTFTSTVARMWTGVGTLMVNNSVHYDGVGTLGGVDRFSESGDGAMQPIKLWLSAVNSSALSEAITESLFGKSVVLKRAWVNNGTIVNTPEQWASGVMGAVNIYRGDAERGNYIEVTVQQTMDRRRRPRYYTAEDLALTYSGDTFFNFLDQIQDQKAMWGTRRTGFGNARWIKQPFNIGPGYWEGS